MRAFLFGGKEEEMIVSEEIRTERGRYGGRYMEDRPEFDVRIYCDRCGKEKPDGRDGLGWYESEGDEVHICPECLETEEEFRVTSVHLQQYIHHLISPYYLVDFGVSIRYHLLNNQHQRDPLLVVMLAWNLNRLKSS